MQQALANAVTESAGSSAKIIRIVAEYPVGGKPTYGLQPVYYNLSKTQAMNGHEVHIIAKRSGGQPRLEHFGGVTIHRIDSPFNPRAMASIRKLDGDSGRAVIHTHSTSGYLLAALRKTVRAPIVCHVHGTTFSAATPVTLQFGGIRDEYSHWRVVTSYLREKALWSAADRVAAVSSSVQSDLISRYGVEAGKIRLVYNGVDADLFRPIPNPSYPERENFQDKKVVLYVGHFGLRKGIPFLIGAMRKVVREVPDSILVCIGGVPSWLPKGDYWSYLKHLIEENGIEGKVILLDRKDNDALPAYYSMARVFVLPSYYEAFPKVLIEAMACEKPVITTRLGGTTDSVEEGVNGRLVRYANPDELAEAIISILQDDDLARRMGRSGRLRVLRDFTWQAVARRIDSIYSELLSN